MKRPMPVKPDMILFVTIVLLICIGSVMVYTASAILASEKFGQDTFFLERHLGRMLIGLVVMVTVMQFDYRKWRKIAKPMLLIGFGLLIVALFPGVGGRASEITGAYRWIKIGSYTIQPVDIFKLILIVWLADSMDRKRDMLKNFANGYLPHLTVIATAFTLIVIQPAFGAGVALLTIALTVLFVGGISMSHLALTTLSALPALILLVARSPYRMIRVLSFLNPTSDPLGANYHIRQSLIGLGTGGFFGVGLGHSIQKLLYLPEPHTDFIFTIIGEEFGFIGAVGMMLLYLIIGWRSIVVAFRSPDFYGTLVATGLSAMIFFGAIINIAVVTGAVPTTGLPLPLVSYGGSSIVFNMIGLGMLLNISQYVRTPQPTRNK